MRITVVTSYFPTSARPYGGNSAFQTLRRLKPRASIQVVSPQEHYLDVPFLKPARYEPADLTWQPPEFETTYVSYPAIPLLTRPFNGPLVAKILLPHVRMTRPDLILNYWLYPDGYAAVRIARELDVPVVVGAIGSDLRTRTDPFTIKRVLETMTAADAVITVSEELRQLAISRGVAGEKVTSILNGCDTTIFYPGDRDLARRQLGVDRDDELIVYAGNLLETKGLGELMDAFAGLAKTRPKARLALVGQGPFRDTIGRRIAMSGLEKSVLLPGRCDATGIAQWMRAADIFCLPSYSEGCPNVVVEALACGRPIVGTNVGGIPELVKKNSGILIPPRDPIALRTALDTVLSATWDRGEIARTSTRSWETVADETWAVCQKAGVRR